MSATPDVYVSGAGEPVGRRAAGPPGRSSDQIRARHRAPAEELGHSVEALRGRVNELTDWRRQIREHRRELIIGAAAVGFAIGGMIALRAAASPSASVVRFEPRLPWVQRGALATSQARGRRSGRRNRWTTRRCRLVWWPRSC